jgi:hypothetical protein
VALWLLAGAAQAGNSSFFHAKVFVTPQPDGSGFDAATYAGVTLVRQNIPNQSAVQQAGQDLIYPNKIFSPKNGPSYFLADAGAQWPSSLASGQQVLAVLETYPGQYGWQGGAYSAGVLGQINSQGMIAALSVLPDATLGLIPPVQLLQADPTQIHLQFGHVEDAGGQLLDLSLWRRAQGVSAWTWLAAVPNPAQGQTGSYNDASVSAETLYEYGLSVDYSWPGGQGAGSRPSVPDIYGGQARSVSSYMAASLKQPTATPMPTATAVPYGADLPGGWLPYPNPVTGPDLLVLLDMERPGTYHLQLFTLDGGLAGNWSGTSDKAGRLKVSENLAKMAGGIYLMHLREDFSEGGFKEFPVKKLAVIH